MRRWSLVPDAVLVALAGLVMSLLPAGAARADLDLSPSTWHSVPGLSSGWVRAFALQGSTIYAGLAAGGVRRSTDGGASWTTLAKGLPAGVRVDALLADPGGVAYAGTNVGLFRTTGSTWARVKLDVAVSSLARSGGTLLAGTAGDGVWTSANGTTWKAPSDGRGMPTTDVVTDLATAPGRVLATSATGIYLSTDGANTWTRVSDGLPGTPVSTTVWAQRPQVLYAATRANGVFRSTDGGKSWLASTGVPTSVHDLVAFDGDDGQHLYAATGQGLWHAVDPHDQAEPFLAGPPSWSKVTPSGALADQRLWALTPPVVPSQGAPGLLVGSQTRGASFLGFMRPVSTCSEAAPMNSDADCPAVDDLTPFDGQTLTATLGLLTGGTQPVLPTLQWLGCTAASLSSCSPLPDATSSTYVVPKAAVDALRYRVRVEWRNAAPTFAPLVRVSQATAVTTDNPSNYPGNVQRAAPGIAVLAPGDTTAPEVGDTMRAEDGFAPNPPTRDAWFNPPSDIPVTFQWRRCDAAGTHCSPVTGATARTYVLGQADAGATMRVRVRGRNATGALSTELESSASYVVRRPAAARVSGPSVLGQPWVGHSVAGSVGVWRDPTTEWSRQWLRCDKKGNGCKPVAGNAATYRISKQDLGSTLRLRVTADVGGDLAAPGDTPPAAVTVDSPATKVVTKPGDVLPPIVTKLKAAPKKFAAGKGRGFKVTSSEAGKAKLTIKKVVGKKLKKAGKVKGKVKKGKSKVAFTGKLGRKALGKGRYVVTLVVADKAGNRSVPITATFTIT